MARKRAEKEETSQEAAPEAAAPAEKMTQREAVEKALAAGKELPADGVPYVLKEFGITLSNQAFSTIKSKINNTKGAVAKKPGRPAKAATASTAAKPAPAPSSNGYGDVALGVEAIKTLCDQLGADQVVRIAQLFGK